MKKLWLPTLLATLSFSMLSCAASFDCAKASRIDEKVICDNVTISGLDDQLATVYKSALEVATNKSALKAEQIAWVKRRGGCGYKETCLVSLYRLRIDELAEYIRLKNDKTPKSSIPQYHLMPVEDGYLPPEHQEVCEPFLQVLNTTSYETLFQDIFLDTLKNYKNFGSMDWKKIEDRDAYFDDIFGKAMHMQLENDAAEKRIRGIQASRKKYGGFDYYLSSVSLNQGEIKTLPILMYVNKNLIDPDKRKSWNYIILNKDSTGPDDFSYRNSEGLKMLGSNHILKYKNSFYTIDTSSLNRISIFALPSGTVCSYQPVELPKF